ncbi:hypothetical protein RirG_228890 [Rhizophagus irregularis DAOM 197198w]|uniref:Uncharacterized protein n=1 Tax=Rhizophagus irregularis (strain DAOM 197198w) TaxID=1432141 RepID=A0A015ILM2_RHIIW|nr:hypothetical protein RirG_228890 [Rhizophagus irregularis DAOM 197198w]
MSFSRQFFTDLSTPFFLTLETGCSLFELFTISDDLNSLFSVSLEIILFFSRLLHKSLSLQRFNSSFSDFRRLSLTVTFSTLFPLIFNDLLDSIDCPFELSP